MIFIQKDKEFINLALVKKIEIDENKIIFYFNLGTEEDYTQFVFENKEKAEHYFNTKILPIILKEEK